MKILLTAVLLFFGFAIPAMAQDNQGTLQTSGVHQGAPQGFDTNALVSARTHIANGDFLAITVFDVPELEQNIRVDNNGNAALFLLGSMHMAGMTTTEAENLIQARLQSGNYIRDPRVSVTIREYASHSAGGALEGTPGVSVLGEVARPGLYPMLNQRTLLEIISDAGGTTPFAAHEVTIKRSSGEVLHASLSNNPSELLAGNLKLELGDMVIVPKAGIAYILGDVGRPGGFVMEDDGKMSLLQLVAMGGGPNHTASTKHARLLRKTDSGIKEEEIDLKKIMQGKQADIALNADDVLFVPNSTLKSMTGGTPMSLMQSAAGAAIYSGIAYH